MIVPVFFQVISSLYLDFLSPDERHKAKITGGDYSKLCTLHCYFEWLFDKYKCLL